MVNSSKKEDCILVSVLGKKLLSKLFIDMHVTQGAELCLCRQPGGQRGQDEAPFHSSFSKLATRRTISHDINVYLLRRPAKQSEAVRRKLRKQSNNPFNPVNPV